MGDRPGHEFHGNQWTHGQKLELFQKIGRGGKRDYEKEPLSEGEKRTLAEIRRTTPDEPDTEPLNPKFGGVGAWASSLIQADRMAEPRRQERAAREKRAAEGYVDRVPDPGAKLMAPDGREFTAGRTVPSRFGPLVTDAADPKVAYSLGQLRQARTQATHDAVVHPKSGPLWNDRHMTFGGKKK